MFYQEDPIFNDPSLPEGYDNWEDWFRDQATTTTTTTDDPAIDPTATTTTLAPARGPQTYIPLPTVPEKLVYLMALF